MSKQATAFSLAFKLAFYGACQGLLIRLSWAMSNRLKAPMVKEALTMAYWRRKPGKGLIYHSDRGSQYAGSKYQKFSTCAVTRQIVQHTEKERIITKARNTENTKRISVT